MTLKTLLPGKDAAVEDTIEMATRLLNQIGFGAEPTGWLNPAPNCWSVHLRSKECKQLYTNGKGTSQQAALASALGEYLERLSTNFFFADYFLDDTDIKSPFLFFPNEKWFQVGNGDNFLSKNLLQFYNPDHELRPKHLYDHNSNKSDRGICCLPFANVASNKVVYFPVSLLNNLYVSNGMAAGNSKPECYSQALAEIIERYVKNIVISKGIALPDIPADVIRKYPAIYSILTELKKHHLQVMVKDCSLGGKFPVICILLAHPESGGAYAAFGASYRFEIAIERTLTELLQGRQLNQLGSFNPPVHKLSLAADSFNLESHFVNSDGFLSWKMFKNQPDHPFTPWDFSGTSQREYILLRNLIIRCGYQIYAADYNHCGMPACRIIVPGMSEIYPVDDLIWNNKNSCSEIRAQLLSLPNMNSDQLRGFLDSLETLNLSDHCLISDLIGVLFDDDSTWSSLAVGEMKALVYLALKQHDSAREWCNWCYDHGWLPQQRKRIFRLLYTLLGFISMEGTISNYEKGLKLYFTEEEIYKAEKIIAGQITFPGLVFGDNWQNISINHTNLMKLYRQINEVKKRGK